MIEFKYRPDVDGLRAVAVIMVLTYHAELAFTGGFVGVDAFFVISGFLITGLILREQKSGEFHLSQFWIRRIRRILPAAMFVAITTLIASFFILLPVDYDMLAKSVIAQQMMASNFFFYPKFNYFQGNAALLPMLHTWSLAVEEQFYIGYPFLLLFLSRFSRRVMFGCIVVLAALSLCISEWGVHVRPSPTFYLLPTRAWELLLGSLLWFAPTPSKASGFFINILSCLGVAGIVIAAWCFNSTTKFPGAAALLPCVSTAILIYANSLGPTWIGRLLAFRPLVLIGLMSYSLYLWHWPILSLLCYLNLGETPDLLSRVLSLGASFILAALSLRFVELPIRKKTVFASTKSLMIATTCAFSLLVMCSLLIVGFDGFPQRFDPQVVSYASAKKSKLVFHNVTTRQVRAGDLPTFGDTEGCYKCLIWGDSHAMALVPGMDAACKTHRIQGLQATHSGTAPILEFCAKKGLAARSPEFNRAVVDAAISFRVDLVVLADKWCRDADSPDFERCLWRTIEELSRAGICVGIVRDVAVQKGDIPLILSTAVHRGNDVEKIGVPIDEYLAQNERCNEIFERLDGKGLSVLDPAPFFVDECGLWRAEYGGESMYRDADHLSIEGSLRLKPMFERLFDSLGLK